MAKKREMIVLAVLATAAMGYIASRFVQKRTKTESLKALGMVYLKEKDFKTALQAFTKVGEEDYEILLGISECHENLGNLPSALMYLNRCIKMRREKSLILKRFETHKRLDMNREAFKDLFLLSIIFKDGEYKSMATDFLKRLCMDMAKAHKVSGWASKINFSDFFDTLFFLKDEQDPAVVFINSKEYEKCFEFIVDSKEKLHRFLLGCFHFVNGDYRGCLRIFDGVDFKYDDILVTLMRSKRLTVSEIEELKKSIGNEKDPTVLYYVAKVFETLDERTCQAECLDNLLEIYPCACATNSKIIWLIKQGRHEEARDLIRASLRTYPEDINLVCIALEYFIMRKDLDECTAILQRAETIYKEDPRIFLFKFMMSEMIDNPEPDFLRRGIELDPRYFKLYIYLGNALSSGKECADAFRRALECARAFDEIYTAYQLLTVVESQTEIFNEYPDLLEN